MTRLLRNPVAQFLALAVVLFVGIVWASSVLSREAAASEAIADARTSTELLAQSVAQPALPPGLVRLRPGAIDHFDRRARDRLLVGRVRRIKIWRQDGTVVYSDKTDLIGQRFELEPDQLKVLGSGETEGQVSDLARSENKFELGEDGLVEVYTLIWAPEGDPLLFEAYFDARDVELRRQEVFAPFQRITLGALLALAAMATPMIWVLTRRLTAIGRERERLLRAAVDASAAERRRIARDLHDGVVQDLAGTAFSLSALARSPDTGSTARATIAGASTSLRASLRALRSLLVEIHPPELTADNLPAALQDLTATAHGAGLEVHVEVPPGFAAPTASVTLIWRVAQEAIRNALRHAEATTLEVVVGCSNHQVTLDVRDNGVGFDPDQPRDASSYGLRGLRSMVSDAGGALLLHSEPGVGTHVRLEVPS